MNDIYFYSLSDPITEEIVYIGQTSDLLRRYQQHIKTAGFFRGNSWMTYWITDLQKYDLRPIIRIISVEHEFYVWMRPTKEEYKYIREYWENGHPLLNRQPKLKGWYERIANSRFWKRVQRNGSRN